MAIDEMQIEIAKGSPVSIKKIIQKSSTETSGLTVSNRLRLSTNGKAASKEEKETIIQTNFVIDRNISVGQVTPSKRKLMEGGGGKSNH